MVPMCDVKLKCVKDNGIYPVNYEDEHISYFSSITSDICLNVRSYASLSEHLSS
jgi:hypothetical protein